MNEVKESALSSSTSLALWRQKGLHGDELGMPGYAWKRAWGVTTTKDCSGIFSNHLLLELVLNLRQLSSLKVQSV